MANPEMPACEFYREIPLACAQPDLKSPEGHPRGSGLAGRTHEARRAPTTPPGQSLDVNPEMHACELWQRD